ncbi:uncharacterized protein CDAR_425031 [Caerostris darwini]|uniref:EGF-like domain-containing protein n=1 Tax=Caerostris darwini TaxID=1538125 RepID=A0AAV4R8H1_9ARAC|nr:uncharacterized protein CDAR_425031 [Caerostris darwini]
MLFGLVLLALICASNAFYLKGDDYHFQEIGFNSSSTDGHNFETYGAEECSCKNGRCVKDSRGHWKCLCAPRHSLKGKDCEPCDCGRNGKCIFTESYFEKNGSVKYEKNCVCDAGFADKYGTCTECICGINSKCEFEYGEKNCYCLEGFAEQDGVCIECNCGEGGYCEFKNGKKTCTCFDFYQFNGDICEECDCGEKGKCSFLKGQKRCDCYLGYADDWGVCRETCIADDQCGNSGTCQKRGDSKFCDCKPGITGDKCEVIDDCVNGKYKDCSGEKGICVYDQKEEKALCKCSGNTKYDDRENICRVCNCGDNGICSFKNGEKRCECNAGYASVNGTCIRCACGDKGTCSFINGAKKCECDAGYVENDGICKQCDCGKKGKCSFLNGQKRCDCELGYTDDRGLCRETCIADDECGNSGTCRNRGDSKFCDCKPGIAGDKCEVIDDCVNGKYKDCSGEKGICVYDQKEEKALCKCSGNTKYDDKENICRVCNCGDNGICSFKNGEKTCECNAGYASVNGTCIRCACGDKGTCSFVNGVKKCECDAGYIENDGICKQTCIADDECGNFGTCQKRGGSEFCDCKPGITGDKCEVIDDCVNGKYKDCSGEKGICVYDQKEEKALCKCSGNTEYDDRENICRVCNCGDNGICSFKNGEKRCECNAGYASVNGTCISCDCGVKGTCSFVNGVKKCECNAGYVENRGICKRPCAEHNDCLHGGRCTERGGQKFCECKRGVTGDRCEIILECEVGIFKNCRNEKGECTYDQLEEQAVCICPSNKKLDVRNNTCEVCDCSDKGTCLFENGVKTCVCKEGYMESAGICRKTCEQDADCENGGHCKEKENGVKFCVCKSGFVGDKCDIFVDCVTGIYKNCKGENGTCWYDSVKKEAVCHCSGNKKFHDGENICKTCDCAYNEICSFEKGVKKCECKDGYYFDRNRVCKASLERCHDDEDCKNGGICVAEGDHKFCQCQPGVVGDKCESIVDCERGKFKDCKDGKGRCIYDMEKKQSVCVCPRNMKLNSQGTFCIETCHANDDCKNGGTCVAKGDHTFCECKPGVEGDNCERIVDCERGTYRDCKDELGICTYNPQTEQAVCSCPWNMKFYDEEKICKECDCGDKGTCYFENGLKICKCSSGYIEDNGICKACDCGTFGECSFDNGKKICHCPYGFQEKNGKCDDCDCGIYGECISDDKGKRCKCQEGFSEKNRKCEICDCGNARWCHFNVEDKVCKCNDGYSEKDGKCEVCDCGENTVCRFVFGAKACDCLPGYLFNSYLQKCAECDCGIEGACYFKEGKKKCDCPTKFMEVNGKCKGKN